MASKSRYSILASSEAKANFLHLYPDIECNHYSTMKELLAQEKLEQATEVLFVESSSLQKTLEKELGRLSYIPSVIVWNQGKPSAKAIEISLPWLYPLSSPLAQEEFQKLLSLSASSARKRRRISALREHQKQVRSSENNPILYLITNLIKICTTAEKFQDLIKPVLALKNTLEFEDACLVLTNPKGAVLQAYYASEEEDVKKFDCDATVSLKSLEQNLPSIFSNSSTEASTLNHFTLHPWSSCISLRFESAREEENGSDYHTARLFLFRRQLMAFTEKDLWLLELLQGPLSLALEKVIMLEKVNAASKEWRSTFDSISEPITVIDNEFRIIKANKSFASLIEGDVKKIKNKKCYALLANRKAPCSNCPVSTSSSSIQGNRIQGRGKKDLLVWSYGVNVQNESYGFQFYRNVSEETSLTATLVQSEKMAAIGKLVGAIAHEINNPLAGILASSQVLLIEAKKDSSPYLDDINEIASAAWRSKKIIDDLLGFTSGDGSTTEKVDIAECVSTAITFSKSALKDIRITLNIEESLPKIATSSSSIQQILFNLITNASHAMKGNGRLEVIVKNSLENKGINIRVKDSGPGIPADILKNIFDPFYTSKVEGKGTGLGLSIVKNLLSRISGKISVTSTLGEGTEFQIHIPIR